TSYGREATFPARVAGGRSARNGLIMAISLPHQQLKRLLAAKIAKDAMEAKRYWLEYHEGADISVNCALLLRSRHA
ncbi:MAG: hypothetical protein H6Q56_987, partial [Deltaproteobacteria bacterium]|nr:hypothetical protein [Deltaproteobacteria bacterium]